MSCRNWLATTGIVGSVVGAVAGISYLMITASDLRKEDIVYKASVNNAQVQIVQEDKKFDHDAYRLEVLDNTGKVQLQAYLQGTPEFIDVRENGKKVSTKLTFNRD